jgi:hypothetical protein
MGSGALIAAVVLGISGAAPVSPATPPEPAPARREGLPIAAVALAATGVVGVAGGAFFGWRAHRIESEIEGQRGLAANEVYQERMDRGRRTERLQWISYGVGAAALIGSAAVYVFTRRPADGPSFVAAVAAAPSGAAVTVGGRF